MRHATIANKLFEAANNGNVTAQIFFLKARAGWRDQGPAVEINSQQNVHVAPDPAALAADRNLIREAIQILRSHGVPAAVELEETSSASCLILTSLNRASIPLDLTLRRIPTTPQSCFQHHQTS
jgi:hypothetical protein